MTKKTTDIKSLLKTFISRAPNPKDTRPNDIARKTKRVIDNKKVSLDMLFELFMRYDSNMNLSPKAS